MRKKARRDFIFAALFGVCLTTLFVTAVFYNFFSREIMEELATCARLLAQTGALEQEQIQETGLQFPQYRLTLIGRDGSVFYDNDVEVGGLDNHGNRPEVLRALEEGSGKSIRRSDTLDQSAFYYAVRLSDGTVLRVAKRASSIWKMYKSTLPIVALTAGAVLALCLLFFRKQQEDLLKNAKMRQEFTANISHELKTPLTAISGYAELIELCMATPEDVTRFAGEIHRSAARLLMMINDIIRLSELDAMEPQDVVFTRVPLWQLAQNCVEMLKISAKKHQVTLVLLGSPCWILGSKEMAEEMLYNLCDNAIRYNREGGNVTVRVEPVEDKVRLCVEDTGIGIAKEHQKRVFERFYRVDKSRSKATGGTGLGLAIVKHMAAQQGAKLTLESEEGRGTRITIFFQNAEKSGMIEKNE